MIEVYTGEKGSTAMCDSHQPTFVTIKLEEQVVNHVPNC